MKVLLLFTDPTKRREKDLSYPSGESRNPENLPSGLSVSREPVPDWPGPHAPIDLINFSLRESTRDDAMPIYDQVGPGGVVRLVTLEEGQ